MIYAILDNRYKLDGFDPSFEVRVDFAEAKLNTITERGGTLSSLFDIEFTANNRKTLEALNQLTNKGERARRSYAVQLFDEEKIIFSGTLVIEGISQTLSCRLFGGGVSVFQAIGEQSIREIDLSAYNHDWSAAEVNSRRTATQGVVYPNINYGRWTNVTKGARPHTDFFPAIYIKTLLQQALLAEGYTVDGLGSFQEAIPFCRKEFSNGPSLNEEVVFTSPVTIEIVGSTTPIKFSNIATNNGGHFEQLTTVTDYFFGSGGTATFELSIKHAGTVGNAGPIAFSIFDTSTNTEAGQVVIEAGISSAEASGVITFTQEDATINANLQVQVIGNVGDEITINSGTSWKIIPEQSEINIEEDYPILIADTLPDISIKELVKYAATKLNALVITDSKEKTVTFRPLNEVASELNRAKDWTAFEVDERMTAQEFQPRDYAQINFFQYQAQQEEQGELYSQRVGRGEFFIANETLEQSKELYEAPFVFSHKDRGLKDTIILEQVIYIPRYSESTLGYKEADLDPKIRAVELKIDDSVLVTITGLTAPATQANAYPVTFQGIGQTAYSALSKALNNYRLIKAQLLLPRREVEQLDFTRPIYFKGAYCYLRLIRGYNLTNPEPTQVELIKLR